MTQESVTAALATECDWCRNAVAAANALSRAMEQAGNYGCFLTAFHADIDGPRFGSAHRVTGLAVCCRKCNGRRRVLTREGEELVKLLVEHGVITAAELERRNQGEEGGTHDSAG